jgi:hypothetical protein
LLRGAPDREAQIAGFFPPPPLPDVEMYKVVHLLIDQGLMGQVAAFIAALPQPARDQANNLLARAPFLVASSSLPQGIQAALGKTDAEYAAFIREAAALEI